MRLSKLFSSTRTAAVLAASVLLLPVFGAGMHRAEAQPPVPAPTPAPPQKPLPTRYAPQLTDANGNPIVAPSDKQSPVNPYPNGGGNAQGRSVGSADPYWGMVNANYPWNQVPFSRVPNGSASVATTANVPLQLDGWSFTAGLLGFDPNAVNSERRDPRANDPRSGNRNGVALNQTASLTIDDQDVYGNNTAPVTATWQVVTGPPFGTTGQSEGAYTNLPASAGRYTRAQAVPRPNTPALQYITAPNPATNPHGFRFPFNDPANTPASGFTRIPGAYGEQARLRISIGIPGLSVDDTLAAQEERISDARYLVFYYLRSATTGAIFPKVKVYTGSQLAGGAIKLINDNGQEAVFPFFSYQTQLAGAPPAGVTPVVLPPQPGLGIVFQGVIVDDTTTDTNQGLGIQYVLADSIQLTAGTNTIAATPTIVGPHGGRKDSNYNATFDAAGNVVTPAPGVQPQQPRAFVPLLGAPYTNQIINEPLASGSGTVSLTNESYSDTNAATGVRDTINTPGFINNPRDPVYNPTNAAYDKTLFFESWNPSTTFMGPSALIDPRRKTNPNNTADVGLSLRSGASNRPVIQRTDPITGQPIVDPGTGLAFRTPGNASDANNFEVYGGIYDAATNLLTNWTPYFSQMQVVVARTEFVADPETGVPDDQKDGTNTIQVGAVYGLDWQTGAPIWRFPDKTYLPGRARNPRIFTGIATDPNPARRQDVYQVPGIVVLDSNGDGSNAILDPSNTARTANDVDIEDEEVFIGQQLGSTRAGQQLTVGSGSGGLFAAITYAPRVAVQGNVQLPTYALNQTLTQFNKTGRYLQTNPGTTIPAPLGRYYNAGDTAINVGDGRGQFAPVLTGMLYVAASNGVVYAIDAFGNNDNYYSPYHPNLTATARDNGVFGNYQPGTTNLLWTFSPTVVAPLNRESSAAFNVRLKNSVPVPASFGASAPVLAYRKDERDNTSATLANHIDPYTDELRLFVGNQNGVLYALDASAQSGIFTDLITGATGVRDLPIRKGDQADFVPDVNAAGVANNRNDLKWWFRTRSGAIQYPPTVSLMKQNAGGAGTLITKGVYFSSQEGRVYCVDWDGPVTRQNHDTPLAWDGTAASAGLLNDDYYFHNIFPATSTARADLTEGDVRPRWAWPNLYRQTQAGTAKTINQIPDVGIANGTRQTDAYDASTVAPINITGSPRIGVPEALGPPTTSPTLMDYLWRDPLGTINTVPQLRSYVAVVMNDPLATGGVVTGSRVYLLDQVGDRANFLSGTQTNSTGTNAPLSVRGGFIDRWTPNAILGGGDVNGETPTGIAWTYRTQYDVFPNNGVLQDPLTNPADLSGRNSPTVNPQVLSLPPGANVPPGQGNAFTSTDPNYPHYRDENYGRPERRTLPTLFVGGPGKLYGLDIDPETGVFMRWRTNIADMARLVVLPVTTLLTGAGDTNDLYPKGQAAADLPPAISSPTKFNDPFFGRDALRDRRILARSTPLTEGDGSVSAISISGGPLQNRNNITPISGVVPPFPTVPTYPTNDAPILRPFLLTGDPAQVPPSSDPDIYNASEAVTDPRRFALSTRTNQDINDPISTTRGSLYSDVPLDPTRTRLIQPETTARVFNQPYQFPTLFAITTNGVLHEISSNIEGEDFSTVASLGYSTTTGWGFQGLGTLENRVNSAGHVEQALQELLGGATGPASGVAIVTPAYFPALDPQFVNTRRAAAPAVVPADNYPNYPYGSPNTLIPTPPVPVGITTANNDDPRPDFHVRPLSPGTIGDPGPDGIAGNADDIPVVLPDRHTGQTGFPLDLNGLFFDKRFAGNGTRTFPVEVGATVYNENFISAQSDVPFTPILAAGTYTGAYPYPALANPLAVQQPAILGQDPNGDYTVGLRLPAYSDIGTGLDTLAAPVARLFNNQQPDGLRANRRSGNLVPLLNEAVGLRSTEPVYAQDPANNATRGDDINPAAQNIAWLYVGGANGTMYGFTPAIPGQQSGLVGGASEFLPGISGGPQGDGGLTPGTSGALQVDLFDQAYFNSYGAAAKSGTFTPPDRAQSVAARGGKNFYEWGETVYIVVSNVTAGRKPNPSDPLNSIPIRFSPNFRVRVIVRSSIGGPTVYDGSVAPIKKADGTNATYDVTEPDGSITSYGVALLPLKIARPTQAKPLTPGDVFSISVQIDNSTAGEGVVVGDQGGSFPSLTAGVGSNEGQQLNNSPAASFAIANPLAVQGYATQTAPSGTTNQVMPVGVPRTAPGETTGGIGPFFASVDPFASGNGTKNEIIDSRSATVLDPNVVGGRYSQALTNGNTLRRRELSALIPDSAATGGFRLNPRFPSVLQDANGGDEPFFYFPVAAGLGYVDHGTTGSTTRGTFQTLRVANRSLLPSLPNIRVQAVDPLLWHTWPGAVPNTEGDLPANAVTGDPALNHNNPRLTPVGMDLYGRINPLPWETGVNENEPYNPGSLANQSPDYPDILLGRTTNAPRIFAGGADISNGSGSLTANILSGVNQSVKFAEPLYGPGFTAALPDNLSVSVSLPIPKYQPANLVAIHSLTSVYQIANQADDPANNQSLDIVGGAGISGPVQLPRGYAARLLHESNTAGTDFTGPQAIAPWGYSTKMVAYVDLPDAYPGSLYPPGQAVNRRVSGVGNSGGTATNAGVIKAYREFELWVGVPAALNLQMAEKEVDLGAEGHGFAEQNGLLGYGVGGGAYATGFLPTPLYNAAAFPPSGNITPSAPYSSYFKPFTVQNTGNVNLWNLRASQKIEKATTIAQAGTGFPFEYFGLRSDAVDSRFGIAAVGADPLLPFMPQVVTSLDPTYDSLWDNYVKNQPAYQLTYNGPGSDPYSKYYAGFQGHHTLHKALPGATSPSVLGLPDVPTAQSIYEVSPANAGAAIPPAPPVDKSVVGVAVPLGTPSGLYRSNLANQPLVVFEDHDTNANGYQPVPQITTPGNIPTLSPAGPLYGGRNSAYFADPSAPGGAQQIQTRGGVSDGTLRARRINTTTNRPEFQPYSDPTFDLRVTVKETGLTGQVGDRALGVGGSPATPPSISTGLLPSADAFPLIDLRGFPRAASSLTPAAYRSANGQIHTYFSRNVNNGGNALTQPGEPYNLFESHLNWNQNLGVFTANNVGVPLAQDATKNQGHWFSTPVIIPAGVAANSSNVTPYVLQEQVFGAGVFTPGAATLFFSNSTPTTGGAPVTVPFFAPLDVNGGIAAQPVPYFNNASPTLQRYAPRAVYVPNTYGGEGAATTYLFYYGGVPGRWSIYYSPRAAGAGGTPTDAAPDDTNGRAERPLTLPNAIVSASDPTPVVRRLVKTPGAEPTTTVDMYYTGVSRATQTPDVYMTRYELRGAGQQARLTPVTLPRVYGEKLVAPGREPVWQGRHISWARDLGRSSLPVIYLPDAASPTGKRAVTVRNNWQYDNASNLLFQTFLYDKNVPQSLTTVYVDASAGTVRFRGAGTPRSTDNVYADYLPQTYRITSDGASNAGTFSLIDQSVLPATTALSPSGAVIKRTDPLYADRQFIFYQKGAQAGKPATLYYSARRVGVDLKSSGLRNTQNTADPDDDTLYNPIGANETIGLNVPTAGNNFNSTPLVTNVTVHPAGSAAPSQAVPVDVDVTNGRIFVTPAFGGGVGENASYENLAVDFDVTMYNSATDQYDPTPRRYRNVLLSQIDEKRDVAVPMTQAVNEGQPYAFLDNFFANPTTPRPLDPTLTPGRIWLFWSTPRGREGTVFGPGNADYPSAYDVFWQTLAPQFDPLLYTVPR